MMNAIPVVEASMRTGRPKEPLLLSSEERTQVQSLAMSDSLPHALVVRAQIILLASEGMFNKAISQRLGVSSFTVGKWRKRFLHGGVEGLYNKLRPGRPRSVSDDQVAALVMKTVQTKPKNATQWSVRSLAAETKVSKSTVHRIWNAFGLPPRRQRNLKLSNDPFFVERVRDICGCS